MGKTAKSVGSYAAGGLLPGLAYNNNEILFGSNPREVGRSQLMTPEQQQLLSNLINDAGPQAVGAFPGLLQGFSEENFQKGVVDPTVRNYRQDILPEIEGRFADSGASSSLNQALASSSEDLSNVLAGQRINYQQGQQQAQLGALNQILGLLGQKSFQPIVQGPQPGILGDIIAALGKVGASAL